MREKRLQFIKDNTKADCSKLDDTAIDALCLFILNMFMSEGMNKVAQHMADEIGMKL